MNNPLDTDTLAKQDIVARPEVTGAKKGDKKPGEAEKAAIKDKKPEKPNEPIEPNRLEEAASAVITEAANEIRQFFGGGENKNMTVLMQEMLNGAFAAMRLLSGRPWLSFVVATGAFSVALLPPVIKRVMAKKEEEPSNGND